MELKAYERVKFATNLRPLLIKQECESCGETEKLELHHDKQFAEMLRETLDRLGYKYKIRKEDYSKEQLENITDMLLGVHIKSTYTTLCEKCHTEIHNSGELITHFLRVNNSLSINILDLEILTQLLESLLNKKLLEDNQIRIKELLSNKAYKIDRSVLTGTKIHPNTFNTIMEKMMYLPYRVKSNITSKRIDNKVIKYTYWIISKVVL